MKATFSTSAHRKSPHIPALRGFAFAMTAIGAVSLFSLTARAEIAIAPDFPVNTSKELFSSKKDAAELLKSYLRDVRPENAGPSADVPAPQELKISLAR